MHISEKTMLTHNHPVLDAVLNSVHEITMILDAERRIVYYNNKFAEFAEANGLKAEIGLKPGGAFTCINAIEGKSECGTTDFCKYCGGNKVITASQAGSQGVSSCRIAAENGKSFELSVSASPIKIDDRIYTLYCITDISAESRKLMLEKIFFHDVNNILNGMSLIMELLNDIRCDSDSSEMKKTFDLLTTSMSSLKNEISSQHIITLAEKDELHVKPQLVGLGKIINEVAEFFGNTMSENEIVIETGGGDEDVSIFTDPVLLKRVIINMVKNACEASAKGEKVTLGYNRVNSSVLIYTNNLSVMPEKVKSSVFKRSFSTKGEGRGLGTYSMRLLTERYLKGNIYFTSEEGEGTTFIVKLPVSLSDQ